MFKETVSFLSKIPDREFWLDHRGGKPDYPGLWLGVMNALNEKKEILISELTRESIPNPSSFQRAVAREAKFRRRGLGLRP